MISRDQPGHPEQGREPRPGLVPGLPRRDRSAQDRAADRHGEDAREHQGATRVTTSWTPVAVIALAAKVTLLGRRGRRLVEAEGLVAGVAQQQPGDRDDEDLGDRGHHRAEAEHHPRVAADRRDGAVQDLADTQRSERDDAGLRAAAAAAGTPKAADPSPAAGCPGGTRAAAQPRWAAAPAAVGRRLLGRPACAGPAAVPAPPRGGPSPPAARRSRRHRRTRRGQVGAAERSFSRRGGHRRRRCARDDVTMCDDEGSRARRRRRHGAGRDARHRAARRGLRARRSARTATRRWRRSASTSPTWCCST